VLSFLFCFCSDCVLCAQCCQFLWLVHSCLPRWYYLTFIGRWNRAFNCVKHPLRDRNISLLWAESLKRMNKTNTHVLSLTNGHSRNATEVQFTDTICPICRAGIVGNPQPIALHPSEMLSWILLLRARTHSVICYGLHDHFSAIRSNHHNLDQVHVYDKALVTWRIHWKVAMTTITRTYVVVALFGNGMIVDKQLL
jgi:hypothetical protein